MDEQQSARLQAKTPEQRFLRVLEDEFHQPPRVAQALLAEAQACLLGSTQSLRPGQMRVILTRRGAGPGRALRATATTEVVWTVDAGREDREVLQAHGQHALRRVRLQRLLTEAVEQGAAATQEDVAQALQVSVRTIKRDCAHLQAQGLAVPTRGQLQGIGRGQTHKAHIVGRWLQGETYDQIVLHTHHCLASIQRYIRAFVQIVALSQQGFTAEQVGRLLDLSQPLVADYLAIYRQHDSPACRERLAAQLQRVRQGAAAPPAAKGGR